MDISTNSNIDNTNTIEDITTSEYNYIESNIKITIDPIIENKTQKMINIDNLKDYYNLLRFTNYNSKKKLLMTLIANLFLLII